MVRLRKSWMLGAATVGGSMLWFAWLAQRPLFDPDEGRYAEIPREMLAGGDWVVPHLNALVYLEKPPLQYWLTALCFRWFGQGEFAARLVTGTAGYLCLIMMYFVARRLWGSAAALRAVLFGAASALFVLLGHQLTLDMLLCCCLTAALACFLLAQSPATSAAHAPRWMLGCWVAMALAVLDKGLIGILIPAAAASLYILWQRDFAVLQRLNLRIGAPLFAAIAVPWFVLAARANRQFLGFFFVREHFQRFLTPVEHRTQPWWFFAPVMLIGIMPWLPQAAAALAAPGAGRVARGSFDPIRLLWVWCVFVLVFFSCSNAKLIPYVLPAVPALALLCAARPTSSGRRSLLAGSVLTAASGLGVLGYVSGAWNSPDGRPLMMLIRPDLYATSALLMLGALAGAVFALHARPHAALGAQSAAWFLACGTLLIAANTAQSLFSAKDAAALLLANARVADPVFTVQSYQQSLPFYLKRSVILVDYRDEFDLGLTQLPERAVPTLQQFAREWEPLSSGFAVMPPLTRGRLLALDVTMHPLGRTADRVIVSRRAAPCATCRRQATNTARSGP